MSGKYTYPLVANDLSTSEMKQLTSVLHIDLTTADKETVKKLTEQISKLPQRLRRNLAYKLVPNSIAPAVRVCSLHKGINTYVIGHIFELVAYEVTVHFKCMDKFPELIPPEQTQIMLNLKAIQGMWVEPSPNRPRQAGFWQFQANRCEACMLSRIAVDRDILCELRMTLLSRTRTKRKHEAPRLLAFVDQCIAHHEAYVIDLCYYSGQRAHNLKAVRKAAVKAHFREERDSKYKYVLRDKDVGSSSNRAYQEHRPSASPLDNSISASEAEYDKRIDSVLAGYGPNMDAESARSVLSSAHGMMMPDPLMVKKAGRSRSSTVSGADPSTYTPPRSSLNSQQHHGCNSPASVSSREPSTYIPPRSNPNWQEYKNHPTSPLVPSRSSTNWQQDYTYLASPSSREPSTYTPPRSTAHWQQQDAATRKPPSQPDPNVGYYNYNPYASPSPSTSPSPYPSRPSNPTPYSHKNPTINKSYPYPTPPSTRTASHRDSASHSSYSASLSRSKSLSAGKSQHIDDPAAQYRELLTPADQYFSESDSQSEYSQSEWEDVPVHENSSAACTTWSLFTGEHEQRYAGGDWYGHGYSGNRWI